MAWKKQLILKNKAYTQTQIGNKLLTKHVLYVYVLYISIFHVSHILEQSMQFMKEIN